MREGLPHSIGYGAQKRLHSQRETMEIHLLIDSSTTRGLLAHNHRFPSFDPSEHEYSKDGVIHSMS